MCGIFGYIGDTLVKTEKTCFDSDLSKKLLNEIVRLVFVYSVARGKDASGFAAFWNNPHKILTDKLPVPSGKFLSTSSIWQKAANANPTILIGHTRLSTSGKPEFGRNNHPFFAKNWSVVHNGQIKNYKEIASKHDLSLRTETDSEVIVRLLQKTQSSVRTAEIIATEATAMAAVDIQSHSLYLYRNNGRPLSAVKIGALNTILFASDDDYIEKAIEAAFYSVTNQKAGTFKGSEIIKILSLEVYPISPFEVNRFGLFNGSPVLLTKLTAKMGEVVTANPPIIRPLQESGKPLLPAITAEPKTQEGIKTAHNAVEVFNILDLIAKNKSMTQQERIHYEKWKSCKATPV